jgi:serine/threonine protein kinase
MMQQLNGRSQTRHVTEEQKFAWLKRAVPQASPHALSLILQCLSWNPEQRPSANDALSHPFFVPEVTKPSRYDRKSVF